MWPVEHGVINTLCFLCVCEKDMGKALVVIASHMPSTWKIFFEHLGISPVKATSSLTQVIVMKCAPLDCQAESGFFDELPVSSFQQYTISQEDQERSSATLGLRARYLLFHWKCTPVASQKARRWKSKFRRSLKLTDLPRGWERRLLKTRRWDFPEKVKLKN